MKDWYAGQIIVCVGEFEHLAILYDLYYPKQGKVYTIREVLVREDTVCLFLNEIRNRFDLMTSGVMGETAFDAKDFRPLDESRLDQFRVHLNPKKVEEPA